MEQFSTGIVTAIFAIIGVVLGGILQFRINKSSESFRRLKELQTQAYVDFTRGVAMIAMSQRNKSSDVDGLTLLVDAKTRIAVYGTKDVIHALAHFEKNGAALDTPERIQNFTTLISTMRKDSLPPNQRVDDHELVQILF